MRIDKIAFILLSILALLLTLIAVGGCTRNVYVPVEKVTHDSVFSERLRVDTLIQKDSVYRWEKGDTVLIHSYHTEYKYKFVRDTAYIARVDSIPVPYEVVREVRYIPKVMKICFLICLIVIVVIVYRLVKKGKEIFS